MPISSIAGKTKFIFITGGVVSSLGKGLTAASIGTLLQARGFKIRMRKFDPYLNIDSGTMSPMEHGEVFVTEDGSETDLDLGSYERFTGITTDSSDSITAGKVHKELLTRERAGKYLGNTVQVIPHMTGLIQEYIMRGTQDCDFVLCEIGGTVGDIEALPFLESIRQLRYKLGPQKTFFIHMTLLPYLRASRELKTKPTQHSVKELLSIGIQPDMIMCRADRKIPRDHLRKIANFCNVEVEAVLPASSVDNVYQLPINYHERNLDGILLRHFAMDDKGPIDLSRWQNMLNGMSSPKGKLDIALVGKYARLKDAYKSLIEALVHSGPSNEVCVTIHIVDARQLNKENCASNLSNYDGIIVAGGFGVEGIEGKILAVTYARENNIPFLGICLGMQLAVIEFARNRCGISVATSSEFDPNAEHCIVSMAHEWTKNEVIIRPEAGVMGGTMRLGGYVAHLKPESIVRSIYGNKPTIVERHRHRYEINPNYIAKIEGNGMLFSGFSEGAGLAEIVELPDHRWFIGVQFHPELRSTPLAPHPLFVSFVGAAVKYQNRIND